MSFLHIMPTQAGRRFSLNAVRLDCKTRCQITAGNACGYSTILRQKAVMAFPNSSRSMAVWMLDCGRVIVTRCFRVVRGCCGR